MQLLLYIYFLYNDFREKKINVIAIGVYGLVALISIFFTGNDISMSKFIDILLLNLCVDL